MCGDCTVSARKEPRHHQVNSDEAVAKYKQSLRDMFQTFDNDIQKFEQKSLDVLSQAKKEFMADIKKTIGRVKDRAVEI